MLGLHQRWQQRRNRSKQLLRSLLLHLCFYTGYVLNFVLPSPSPLPCEPSFNFRSQNQFVRKTDMDLTCQDVIASAVSLLYRTMHCTTFSSPRTTLESSIHRVNRGTLCGYCFPQLIKICLARIPLPRCLDPSRHVTLPPDGTVLS